jgi:hypothetical protein
MNYELARRRLAPSNSHPAPYFTVKLTAAVS